jgi:ribosome biogenesis GTPase
MIVVNKSDLADDSASLTWKIIPVSTGIPVDPVRVLEGGGFDRLGSYLAPGTTIVLIGSSVLAGRH